MYSSETIVAIATPPGKGGIGIVRVSGSNSYAIAQTLLKVSSLPPRHAHFGHFYANADVVIDEGITLWFPAPASFTGEDVLELHAHGSPMVLDLLVARITTLGARMAQPGEFSRRAFENGKYDLLQIEAVADLINSASHQAAQSAQRSLQGVFSSQVKQLLRQMIELRVQIEAAIDFSDDDIDIVKTQAVQQKLDEIQRRLNQITSAAETGVRLCNGAEIVIVGKPNAGKSSLLNCLAGRDEAIVSDTAGTTRDVVKCEWVINGVPIRLLDTAGLGEPQNSIEAEGMRRAEVAMRAADLVIMLVDAVVGLSHIEQRWMETLKQAGVPYLLVFNKTDLLTLENLPPAQVAISAKTGTGLPTLRQQIGEVLGTTEGTEPALSARRRHLVALAKVQTALDQVTGYAVGETELVAEELRAAQTALAELTGEFTNEDLLGAIFSEFCIGK